MLKDINWKINKDETICGYVGSRLVAAIWRKRPKEGEEIWLQSVIYGPYPDVWVQHKVFDHQEQVKEVKQWCQQQL